LADKRKPGGNIDALLKEAQNFTGFKEEKKPRHNGKIILKAEKTTSNDSSNLRILYVEDDPNDQAILRRSLDKNLKIKFSLITADTGSRGLSEIKEGRPDLVLLDYRLPDMTGLDFLDQMKKGYCDTDVILITGQGNERVAVEAMKRGAKDYVTKDATSTEQFAGTIRDLVLGSTLSKELNEVIAKQIVTLFSTSPALQSNVLTELNAKADGKLTLNELVDTLKRLAKTRSVIACPSCNSTTFTPYLKCPECGSLQIVKEGTLEHVVCGCIDFTGKFDKGEGELVCPNCCKKLEQLGVDYRRLESWFKCSNDHLFANPILSFRCLECKNEFNIDAANLKSLYWYQIAEAQAQNG
jgi:CheY-like chemotaxis protein/DNA-directed RNA polymerase subunit RPC12/RpoP